jgi:hypothetical protein
MNLNDSNRVELFFDSLEKTNPSLAPACRQVVEELLKSGAEERSEHEIKKEARLRTKFYQLNRHNSVLLSKSVLVSELVHGDSKHDEFETNQGK